MGVTGLLRQLKSIESNRNISDYAGKTVAIDGYAWLHRGATSCAEDLALGRPTVRHINYFMRRLQLLISSGVTPFLVFDGANLPSKAETEHARNTSRAEARQKALQFKAAGRGREAYEQFSKCVEITPTMAALIIEKVRPLGIQCIVAPYEADPQMVYLERLGLVDAILSEDSDLLVFGATTLLTKMNETGALVEIAAADFGACRELNLGRFGPEQWRLMAILSGCDYSKGVPRVGLKTANKLIVKFGTASRTMAALHRDSAYAVPDGFDQLLQKADLTFQHQRVYCPRARKLVYFTAPSADAFEVPEFTTFIGPAVSDAQSQRVAEGKFDPIAKKPIVIDPDLIRAIDTPTRPPAAGATSINSFFTPRKSPPTTAVPFKSTPALHGPRFPSSTRGQTTPSRMLTPQSIVRKRVQQFFSSDDDEPEGKTVRAVSRFFQKTKTVKESTANINTGNTEKVLVRAMRTEDETVSVIDSIRTTTTDQGSAERQKTEAEINRSSVAVAESHFSGSKREVLSEIANPIVGDNRASPQKTFADGKENIPPIHGDEPSSDSDFSPPPKRIRSFNATSLADLAKFRYQPA